MILSLFFLLSDMSSGAERAHSRPSDFFYRENLLHQYYVEKIQLGALETV